jgi:hypothetical protein
VPWTALQTPMETGRPPGYPLSHLAMIASTVSKWEWHNMKLSPTTHWRNTGSGTCNSEQSTMPPSCGCDRLVSKAKALAHESYKLENL